MSNNTMAEVSIDGGPIFVDVSADQQYPVLYNQLLSNNTAESTVKNEVQAQEPNKSPEDTQNKPQSTSDSEDVDACIKIEERRVRCPECKRFTAETEEKMLRHIRKVHRGENPFQCYMCDYSTYNKAVFEEHVRIHQGIKPFKCSHCDYKSASKKNTKKHELVHRADNPLKCADCGFIARHPRSLDSHKAKEHRISQNDSLHQCDACQAQFVDVADLRRHNKYKRTCKACNFKACSKKLYNSHLMDHHQKNNQERTKSPTNHRGCQ
ncbi:gastrula zinc finger protein XlCGF49.1-like isoform X2 [Pectinophora gossypiella]|uniref:gastrula zinc finger protein XlCGF49.1-like isoform X2 n=1 Tax=Pectinophora gossypiella TaxID=13191 RepID=UPI00214E7D30|nr:gastrula zinc finger protein XlCGF49.1-like isoform X2 [Pectinophora gossypiella]